MARFHCLNIFGMSRRSRFYFFLYNSTIFLINSIPNHILTKVCLYKTLVLVCRPYIWGLYKFTIIKPPKFIKIVFLVNCCPKQPKNCPTSLSFQFISVLFVYTIYNNNLEGNFDGPGCFKTCVTYGTIS